MKAKKRILIVDDDADVRECLSVILARNGYEPVTAADGEEALNKAVQSPPALILLDLLMPGKSGVKFLNEIKQDESLRHIPIVVQSAVRQVTGVDMKKYLEDQPHRERKARAMGRDIDITPDGYFEKPVDPKALIKMVEKLT